MRRPGIVDVSHIIDGRPLGALQIRTAVLCGIVAILDGFDNFAIALVAPAVAQELSVPIWRSAPCSASTRSA